MHVFGSGVAKLLSVHTVGCQEREETKIECGDCGINTNMCFINRVNTRCANRDLGVEYWTSTKACVVTYFRQRRRESAIFVKNLQKLAHMTYIINTYTRFTGLKCFCCKIWGMCYVSHVCWENTVVARGRSSKQASGRPTKNKGSWRVDDAH